jgi:glucuronate isomerase
MKKTEKEGGRMRSIQNEILLTGERARALFQKTACDRHLMRGDRALLRALAENKVCQTPTDLWIVSDPHATALLRVAGAEETFVTGNGSDLEKFRIFCTVMGDSVGNPLKLHCHMALREVFGCSLVLNETNCEEIWRTVCRTLSLENITPREYLKRCGVDTVLVPMAPHEPLDDFACVPEPLLLPVFAPDAYFLPTGKGFAAAVRALDGEIVDFKSFCRALLAALDRFAANGCRVAVQGVLPTEFWRPNEYHAALCFEKALAGECLTDKELALYQAQLWRVLCEAYATRDMTLELCVGETPQRAEASTHISGHFSAKAARELLDYLKERVGLPRVALYTERSDLIPTTVALAARYPAKEEGVPQIVPGVWQTGLAETRAQLRALASATSLSSCLGAFPDMRLPRSPFSAALFHRALCAELSDWEAHGEIDVGEENLCRVISALAGESMRKYYKL